MDEQINEQNSGLGTRSLFVVGDDAQSIYGFRGSKIEIILGFEKVYKNTTEIILNQNYRSTQPILDLAEKVLTHNSNQKKKDLFTDKPEKSPVIYYLARNERDEAEFILRKIHELYIDQSDQEPSKPTIVSNPQIDAVKKELSLENLKLLLEQG
jgi:superfamily I DNA/RNA helicase